MKDEIIKELVYCKSEYVKAMQKYTNYVPDIIEEWSCGLKYPFIMLFQMYSEDEWSGKKEYKMVETIKLTEFEIKCEQCKNWHMLSLFKLGDFDVPQTGRCSKLDTTTAPDFGCTEFNIYL